MNLICISCGGFTYFEVEVEAFKTIEINDDGLVIEDDDWILRANLDDIVKYILRDPNETITDNGNKFITCARCGSRNVVVPYVKWNPPLDNISIDYEGTMIHQLIRFVPIADKIIPRNTTLPILTNICVNHGVMRATDLETTAVLKIDDDRSYLLPIGIVKTIIKSKPKNIEIELLPENKIQINYHNRGIIFPAMEVQDYPEPLHLKFNNIGTWTKQVLQELYHQLLYCSTDELRAALTGVFVRQNSSLLTCATDGHVLRLIRDVDPEKKCKLSKKFEGVISNKCIQLLARFAINSVKVHIAKGIMKFDLDDSLEIYSRLIDGQYPMFENVLPEDFSGMIHFDRELMLNLTNDAKPFSNRYTHLSKVKVNEDHLTLTVEDAENDTNWHSNMPVNKKTGNDIHIGLDLDLLQKVLKSIDEKEVLWSYTNPTSASTFTSANGNPLKITNVLMPIRLQDKEETDG